VKNRAQSKWTAAGVPEQRGRVVVITGPNSGVGYATASVLADKGARVVLAVRNLDKGKRAAAGIVANSPHADVALRRLDLTSLESVRTAAAELHAAYPKIDLLINNAGVMLTPKQTTIDGFELQFATNHLGHFALTGLLLDRMLDVDGSRVVAIGSQVHRVWASIHFDDLQWQRRYNRWGAYSQSKLANLMFAFALNRHLTRAGSKTIALAAHPGGCYSQQVVDSPAIVQPFVRVLGPLLLQSPQMSALSPLRAATDPAARGGQYYGPNGIGEVRGYPRLVDASPRANDEELQERLWKVSEELTGISYPV
jgi:NAD(P)-dependent dehydrogenase (short-subunit alcohol dehydrogenase family)